MQKKSAIRTKPIPQRTKETSNCCSGLRFPVLSSRKVHGLPNSENWNLARPVTLKICYGSGVRDSLHVSDRNMHVPPMQPYVSEKTHVPTNGSANVNSRKRTCHRNAFQRNSAVETTLHHLKTALHHRNSAEPLQ